MSQSANSLLDLLHAYLRYEVVGAAVMPALRAIASAPEEHLVSLGVPHRGFMRKDRARLRGDGPDGRFLAQDTQELRVEDLEERRAGVGGVEVLVECVLAEVAAFAQYVVRAWINDLPPLVSPSTGWPPDEREGIPRPEGARRCLRTRGPAPVKSSTSMLQSRPARPSPIAVASRRH